MPELKGYKRSGKRVKDVYNVTCILSNHFYLILCIQYLYFSDCEDV
jgi:hypothetical protein